MTLTLPPAPKARPIIGHLIELQQDSVSFLTKLGHEYGDISHFKLGARTLFFVNNPDYIQQVIQSNKFVRSTLSRKLLASFLGDGVFSQEGELHHSQRRLMQPAFHNKRLEQYAAMMIECGEKLAVKWQDGETRDIDADMMKVTLQIVTQTLFGSSTSDEAVQVGRAFNLVQEAIDTEYELYSLMPDWMPIMRMGRYRRAVETLQRVTKAIIQERRQSGKDQVDQGDLLSMLLMTVDEDGTRMTDSQVCGQVLSMIFAGHETTANTMNWIWYLLSQNPDTRQKLYDELDSVLGGHTPTYTDLPSLKYTEMVVKESLRIYPSAWYAERTPTEDVQIGNYTVKAGIPVVVSVMVTHRDPRYFDEPMKFRPERFSPENIDRIPKGAYLPFGAGVHMCIGNSFAMMEMRLLVALLAQKFELKLVPDFKPKIHAVVTMGLSNGLPMVVSRRN